MDTDNFDKSEEQSKYEEYMGAEGYVKIDGKWVLVKYPEKDPKSYKESLPSKG